MAAKEKKQEDCTWCIMRALSPKSRPINKAEWRVKVSKDSAMFAGKTILLCTHHKNNLALNFDSEEKLR